MPTRRTTIRIATLLAPALVLGRGTIAHARDLSGAYAGTWGATTLAQEGYHVSGTYAFHHGQIDGVLVGDTMRFSWIEDDGSGRGVITVGEGGALTGTWGMGYDDHHGGAWRLVPVTAVGVDAGVRVAPPHAGTWTLGVRYPWGAQSIPDGFLIGLGGLELDAGLHVTEHLYAGASGESVAMTRVSDEKDVPNAYGRLRAGGEARVYLYEDAETRDWLGVRYGVESFDEGTTIGRFADVTIASELVVSGVGVAIGITGGVSREPARAFGDPAAAQSRAAFAFARAASASESVSAPADQNASKTCPYVALAIGVVFE